MSRIAPTAQQRRTLLDCDAAPRRRILRADDDAIRARADLQGRPTAREGWAVSVALRSRSQPTPQLRQSANCVSSSTRVSRRVASAAEGVRARAGNIRIRAQRLALRARAITRRLYQPVLGRHRELRSVDDGPLDGIHCIDAAAARAGAGKSSGRRECGLLTAAARGAAAANAPVE
jgi:hypothetical protein